MHVYWSASMSTRSSTDELFPGKGYSPDYGINDSTEGTDGAVSSRSIMSNSTQPPLVQSSSHGGHKKDKVWVVAMCALIACTASLVIGLMLGFSSPTLNKLDLETGAHHIESGSKKASLFGVGLSVEICKLYIKLHVFVSLLYVDAWTCWCPIWWACCVASI